MVNLSFPLFEFLGRTITLWSLIVFLLIIWVIGILPSPIREILSVLYILFLLTYFGVISIPGLFT